MAKLTKLGALWVKAESTFSTDPDTDGSSYLMVPAEGISVTLAKPPIEREVMRSGLGQSISSTPGQKGGTVSFIVPLHGLATAAASAVAAVLDPWLQALLEACGLLVISGTGTAVTGSGSTTTVIDVTSAAGITAGTLVMIGGEVRLVTAVDTGATPDNITVTPALSAIPTAATVVYSSASAVIDNAGTYEPTTAAFAWQHDGDEVTLLGCAGTVKIEPYDAGARPMLSFEFQVNTWANTTNKVSLPSSVTFRSPLLAKRSSGDTTGSALFWGSTATPLASSKTGFDPALTLSPKPAVEGIEGRIGWVVTAEAAMFDVTPYSAQSTYYTDYEAATNRTAVLQLGNAGGAAFGVASQQTQIMDLPAEADVGGIRGSSLKLRARTPSTSGLPGFTLGWF